VPSGGAMDQAAAQIANTLVGNPRDAACLEWALGGGTIRFDADHAIAITGAAAEVTLGGKALRHLRVALARGGDELEVGRIGPGRFLYVAIAGGIDVPPLIGSRATYLPGRFGGFAGRSLRAGDSLRIGEVASAPRIGIAAPPALAPDYSRTTIRVTRGTHGHLLDAPAWSALLSTEYRISSASDRTGYRLEGDPVPNSLLSLASEAGCPGVIQVPGDGLPIILMADGPTVGGYPKIAVVSEADLPVVAQKSPGDSIRFELVEIEKSQELLRARSATLAEFESGIRRNSAATA
jgi:antagonist of KipI